MHSTGAEFRRAGLSCAQFLHVAFCFFAEENSFHGIFLYTVCNAWNIFTKIFQSILDFSLECGEWVQRQTVATPTFFFEGKENTKQTDI